MNLALSILQGLFWTWKTKVGYEFYLHLYKIIRSNIKPRKLEKLESGQKTKRFVYRKYSYSQTEQAYEDNFENKAVSLI